MIISEKQIMQLIMKTDKFMRKLWDCDNFVPYGEMKETMDLLQQIQNQQSEELKEIK